MRTKTLEEIIKAEQTHRHESGQFGIDACKNSIRFSVEHLGSNLTDLLNEYVERANTDAFFNKAMVLACWELMQEEETKTTTEEGKTMKNYICRRGTEADRINAVIEAYEATRDGKTADTVTRLVESLGREGAAVAVATVVNAVSPHDGRISDRVREWARYLDGDVPSNSELRAVGIYGVDSWIHSAHVDNLGTAMMRYLRNTPAEEITEEPKEEIPHLVINAPAWEREKAEAEPEEPTEEETAEAEKRDLLELLTASRERIEREPQRSAWNKGVNLYALELVDYLEELAEGDYLHAEDLADRKTRKKAMLNGAQDWEEFSWGGCSLIYNGDIAERLCTPSELKKTRNGDRIAGKNGSIPKRAPCSKPPRESRQRSPKRPRAGTMRGRKTPAKFSLCAHAFAHMGNKSTLNKSTAREPKTDLLAVI